MTPVKEEPYTEDSDDTLEQLESGEGGVWSWLKGLGGAGQGDQKLAQQLYKVS